MEDDRIHNPILAWTVLSIVQSSDSIILKILSISFLQWLAHMTFILYNVNCFDFEFLFLSKIIINACGLLNSIL